jgi:hypothetical protein
LPTKQPKPDEQPERSEQPKDTEGAEDSEDFEDGEDGGEVDYNKLDDDEAVARLQEHLRELMEREAAFNPAPKEEVRPPPDVEQLYFKGSLSQKVEFQLGILSQAVGDCIVFASGSFPNLSEGPLQEVPSRGHDRSYARPLGFAAARSLQLNDAARLSEATARLLTGFAKIRGQFAQDFTMRCCESRDAKGRPRQVTTVTHRFSLPREEASQEAIATTREAVERVRAKLANM